MSPEQKELAAQAVIGQAAKDFVDSDLGRTILGIADQQIQVAWEALEKVTPNDFDEIQRLQNEIKVARSFKDWLTELITDGENAVQIWRQQNES